MAFEIKHRKFVDVDKLKKAITSGKVKVGLPKGKAETYESGETTIEVGATHEFGEGNIPERSFIRVPVQHNKEKYIALAAKQAKLIFNGKQTVEDALGILGLFMSDKMKASFGNNDWSPNSQQTIASKGSSSPLIDTGQLRQSITWQIVQKD
ncbi:MAG: hypothetical protein U9Q29_02830 [Campylobacterota bacterium]|nr:hypothetical protein [Campylobacterota bacterium]